MALLADKQRLALERLFRILGLGRHGEDFERIHRGLSSQDPRTSSSSRELLEHLLKSPVREIALALIDDHAEDSTGVRGEAELESYEALLEELLKSESESIRCLTALHVGELGLTSFRKNLERASPPDGPVAKVVARAIAMLDRADPETHAVEQATTS